MTGTDQPRAVIDRLLSATNAHDVDAIAACFATDYVNRTPVHPARGFVGSEQVRRNWTQILGGVPDLVATTPAVVVDGNDVWAEMDMRGTRRDGVAHAMVGVVVFTVADGLITAARFYLEPLDEGVGTVDDNVRNVVTR